MQKEALECAAQTADTLRSLSSFLSLKASKWIALFARAVGTGNFVIITVTNYEQR